MSDVQLRPVLSSHMTASRTAPHPESADVIEYDEALLASLKMKVQRQIQLAVPDRDDDMVTLCRLILDIEAVESRLGRERYRISLFPERKR